MIMKFSFIFLFIVGLQIYATGYSQSRISMNAEGLTMRETLKEIEKQTGYRFFYSDDLVLLDQKIDLHAVNLSIDEILGKLFNASDLGYRVYGNNTVIVSVKERLQGITVSGTVADDKGEPLPGVNVLVKGTMLGAVTDVNGKYILNVSDKGAVLVFSFVGFVTQEIEAGAQTVIDVLMVEDIHQIDEVVVTALGIKRDEKALGYAVQTIANEDLTIARGANVVNSLTGKIAGVSVTNSTEFMGGNGITLRGYGPLIVIDGVMFGNTSLDDIPAEDIESLSVLKGPTGAALYGSRGANGVIMVTTKKAKEAGLHVSINSSTMLHAGYTAFPEVQTAYSSGNGGRYVPGVADYVWGDRLDAGRTGLQYNPYTYEWEMQPLTSRGKNNFQNFLEQAIVTNNNVSVEMKGDLGGFRASVNHIYNKGQYPNQDSQNYSFSVGGNLDYKRFHLDAGINYHKLFYSSNRGTGYGQGSFMYNMVIWTGAEYDIRDYRNYWLKGRENEQQNWFVDEWYDNPYFLAYEKIASGHHDKTNSYLTMSYDITDWLQAVAQFGIDAYANRSNWRTSKGATPSDAEWEGALGYYYLGTNIHYSTNNDFRLMADKRFGDFRIDGFIGGSLYYYNAEALNAETSGGINMPGFYSLYASVEKPNTGHAYNRDAINSLYGKVGLSWRSLAFVEVTGRNDWSSTLAKAERSYFYPSVSGSLILSEFIPLPKVMDFWKVRASWTQTKHPADRYVINQTYGTPNTDYWGGISAIAMSSTIRDATLRPSASASYELGADFRFFGGRLNLDGTYYERLNYDLQRDATMSSASGYSSTLVNYGEEHLSRGVEIAVSGDLVKRKDFTWNSAINWAADRYYYHKVDEQYSTKYPWVAAGKNWHWIAEADYERDPEGNIIHYNGMPKLSDYLTLYGSYNPDWVWGWTNRIRYRNFHLAFSFDGRVGGLMFNSIEQYLMLSGRSIDTDTQWRYEEVVDGNRTPYVGEGVRIVSGSVQYDDVGNITDDTRVFAPNDVAVSYETYTRKIADYTMARRFFHKKTFLKLREVSLSYDIPKSLCRHLGMQGAEISVVGQNLLLWTKDFRFSDPDINDENINSPSIRLVGLNLKLNF
jgi:TonB-linked SusC/RagA family outer membrane protein